MINFRTATTSEKLNFLAKNIEGRHRGVFSQWNPSNCIVGIGNSLDGRGRRSMRPYDRFENSTEAFAKRFGITENEATNLYVGEFADLRVGATRRRLRDKSPQERAAFVLRGLARKYAGVQQ